jgi:hypothetical protein
LPRLALLYRRKLREHLSIWRFEPGWAACALAVLTNIKILTEFGVTIQFLCTVKLMVASSQHYPLCIVNADTNARSIDL